MKYCIALLLVWIGLNTPAAIAGERQSRWKTLWRFSQGLLVGANAADAATSWGKGEANPLMRTGTRFGFGSMAIKTGLVAGTLTLQHIVIRKNPERAPFFVISNTAGAALLGVVAARNAAIAR
ncbi:MAG: hypothetical protein U0Q18_35790 [Bryobacteraceae bacterium]